MVYPDKIIRSNRKTLSISIDTLGRLVVRAPMRCGKERIFAFISQKEKWILRKQAEVKGSGVQAPPSHLEGYRLPLLGEEYTLSLTQDKRVRLDTQRKILYLPKEKAQTRLVAWLKRQAKDLLQARVKLWEEKMGVRATSVSVTSARTRWGSCTFENKLNFTYRLYFTPIEMVDYVVVHELAHIRHKNHSSAFWQEVERYFPPWREKRKWLKINRALISLFS